jgi:hypothetical protein
MRVSVQKPQPLIWLARIFPSPWIAAGGGRLRLVLSDLADAGREAVAAFVSAARNH